MGGRDTQPGQVFRLVRTYSREDVARFTHLSGDTGRHHLEPGADGRLMVHGLFVAMLPTQLGSELAFVARDMSFEFVRPVFTGDTITCELTVTEVTREDGRTWIRANVVCTNQVGKEVMRGKTRGVLPE